MADLIKTVPLSRNTITRRIEDLSKYLDRLLKDKLNCCSFVSLSLDETCDISDVSQLILVIRIIDQFFNVYEEVLGLISLLEKTRGVDIFIAITGRID